MQISGALSVRRIVAGAVSAAVLAGLTTTVGASPAAAAACSTSILLSGTSVDVCITAPADGPSLTGDAVVTAAVTPTVPGTVVPAVNRVVFSYRGTYLLADHDLDAAGVYGFTFHTRLLPDGPGRLTVRAEFVDGSRTPAADISAPLANGVGAPPAPTFTPSSGTPAPLGQRFRIAAVGDGADGSPAAASVAALMRSWSPNLFAYLGDVYDQGSPEEFLNWYDDPVAGFGALRPITNPTIGNHEYRYVGGDGLARGQGYADYWGAPPHYYSYNVAGWHVVVLDSTDEFGQLTPGTPQYDWLAADLAADPSPCTLAYLHHPRYATTLGNNRLALQPVWSLLHDSGVSLMVAGHAHRYERWTSMNATGTAIPNALTQLVVGTGGREVINPSTPDARMLVAADVPGALQLDLGPRDAAFAFIGADGVPRDSGVLPCRTPPDTTPPTVPGGLVARATSPTAATVSWAPAADDVGVAGYSVRRGDAVVATLDGATTSYSDGALTPETTHTFSVDAVDAAGNRSPPSAAASVTTPFPTLSTRALLRGLTRAPERNAGWRPGRIPGWTDADRDGCATPAEVLLTEAVRAPTLAARCRIAGGRWLSPYDGKRAGKATGMTVDRLVPPQEAWASGARAWSKRVRQTFANDLGYPASLVAVRTVAAAAKAGREPTEWLPTSTRYRCTYLADWVAVKWRWGLSIDQAERKLLATRLASCRWPAVRVTTQPRR